MKKSYVIVPAVLLAVFLVFQQDFQRKRNQREKIQAAELAAVRAAEAEERDRLAREAADRTQQAVEERARKEREREEAKRRDFTSALERLNAAADAHAAAVDDLERQVAAAEQRASELRARQARAEEGAFELARQVELQRIDRRTAELEIQRATKLIFSRLLEQ